MLRLEGTRDVDLPPAELRTLLADPAFLVACAPDVEAVKVCEATHAALTIRPALSFVRGTLDVTLRVLDDGQPDTVQLVLSSKGIGSSSELEAVLTLTGEGAGTRVGWAMAVTALGGLLKLVPQGLIRGAAVKVINDAWDRVSEQVKARCPGPPTGAPTIE